VYVSFLAELVSVNEPRYVGWSGFTLDDDLGPKSEDDAVRDLLPKGVRALADHLLAVTALSRKL